MERAKFFAMNSSKNRPLRAAIVGMGGFARLHHAALRALEIKGEVQVVATCDLDPDQFPALRDDLLARGARIYRDLEAMLDAHPDLDFAAIATPIPLHAPMHRACVTRGIAVYLEKPPTLDWRELDAMIALERDARFATQVGFNFIGESARQTLKKRLVAGEFGRLKVAGFVGCWPRGQTYYQRARWAGKLKLDGHLVLDSCVGNAFAHYVHNALFWCGQSAVESWGRVEEVEAELYRAHPIESFDTVFARGVCASGDGDQCEIRVGATHAAAGAQWQREWLECENAAISYKPRGGEFEIVWHDGARETGVTDAGSTAHWLEYNLSYFVAYLRGARARSLNSLRDSRPFVVLNDLMIVAASHIATVPARFVRRDEAQGFCAIENIEAELENFARDGLLPAQSGLPWSQAGGHARADELTRLDATLDAIMDETEAQTPAP